MLRVCVFLMILIDLAPLAWALATTKQFMVVGKNSLRGDYQGWISVESDGSAKRVIQFTNYQVDQVAVQEAWLGHEWPNGNLEFPTRYSQYIYNLNGRERPQDEVFRKKNITLFVNQNNSYDNADGSVSTEVIRTSDVPVDRSFYFDVNTELRDVYSPTPPPVKLAILAAKKRFSWDTDAEVKELETRSHCAGTILTGPRAQAAEDFSDLNFYREFKNIIRVYNSPATDFALAESAYRKAAFGEPFVDKIKTISSTIDPQFINDWGMNSYSFKASHGGFVYSHDNDSALWTGEYAAYLGHMYMKTKKVELLEKIKKTTTGLMLLVELFEGSHEFGRTIEDYHPGERLNDAWLVFEVDGRKLKVKKGGNNDMYKGVLLGLTVASLTVPQEDQAFHDRLRKVTNAILSLKVQQKSNQTKMLSYGLAAIVFNSQEYRAKYIATYKNLASESTRIYDGTFYWNGTSDYSGVNLGIVGIYTSYLQAKALSAGEALRGIEQQVLQKKETFKELGHLEALLLVKKIKPNKLTPHDQIAIQKGLSTFPFPRPDLSVKYDHSWQDDFCLSPTPYLFWKAFKKEREPANRHLASLTNYPIYKTAGIDSNYIFKDAYFKFRGQVDRRMESSRIDMLFAWTLFDNE